MKRNDRLNAFVFLGKIMVFLGEGREWSDFSLGITQDESIELKNVLNRQAQLNPWFTQTNVKKALFALGSQLTAENLSEWSQKYSYQESPKRVGLILAGNIPLVGFHDILSVILSGNTAVCKLSSDDATLLPVLFKVLSTNFPEIVNCVEFSSGKIGNIDAVIATGSNNSVKYFEQYFGKYPHVFRKNRTSIAILDVSETEEELKALGEDIFEYFGMGCRNVSHLMIPADFDINRFFGAIVDYGGIVNHHKYANNYDYNKAIFLMNRVPILDNNFVLMRETDELISPLAVIHYHRYSKQTEVVQYLKKNEDSIQAIVGKKYIPFGQAQCPALSDYADGVDTMEWLATL